MRTPVSKIALGIAAALALGAAGYFLFRPAQAPPDSAPTQGPTVPAMTAPAPPPPAGQTQTSAQPPAAPPTARNGTGQEPPAPAQPQATENQVPLASAIIQEDKTVTFDFVEDVATYLLEKYRPGQAGGKGSAALAFSKLNARYGVSPTGMARVPDSIQKTRQYLLDSILTPQRLAHLHALYADPFVTMMQWCAENVPKEVQVPGGGTAKRLLAPAETADMMEVYAAMARRTGAALGTLAAHREIPKRVGDFDQLDRAAQAANTAYQELLEKYGHDSARRQEQAPELHEAAERLKQAISSREDIRREVQAAMAKWCQGCKGEDPAELFAMAQWVRRRTANAPEKFDAVAAGAGLLEDVARRLEAKAKELRG